MVNAVGQLRFSQQLSVVAIRKTLTVQKRKNIPVHRYKGIMGIFVFAQIETSFLIDTGGDDGDNKASFLVYWKYHMKVWRCVCPMVTVSKEKNTEIFNGIDYNYRRKWNHYEKVPVISRLEVSRCSSGTAMQSSSRKERSSSVSIRCLFESLLEKSSLC